MDLSPDDFQSPLPEQNVHVYWGDDDLGLYAGVWETTTMQEAYGPYPCNEVVMIQEGRFTMVDGENRPVLEIEEGETALMGHGVPISWKQEGYLRKYYVAYADPKGPTPEIASPEGGVAVLDRNAEMTVLSGEAGSPDGLQREHVFFTSSDGRFEVGMWDCTARHGEMGPFPFNEWAQIIDGEVRIIEADGTEHVLREGDVFFTPKGTMCRWQVDLYVRKFYALLQDG